MEEVRAELWGGGGQDGEFEAFSDSATDFARVSDVFEEEGVFAHAGGFEGLGDGADGDDELVVGDGECFAGFPGRLLACGLSSIELEFLVLAGSRGFGHAALHDGGFAGDGFVGKVDGSRGGLDEVNFGGGVADGFDDVGEV